MADRIQSADAGRPSRPGVTGILERNIRSLQARLEAEEARATFDQRIARAITDFTGSMPFVYLHLAIFAFWIAANLGWFAFIRPWDPTFVVLAMVASVEAIFLSTFVLITQNRMASMAERRANLDLQINLLAEHEITRLIRLVSAIAVRSGIDPDRDPELSELKDDIAPEAVLDEIESSG
ncbi:MAG TPA: DUF1003 domain-containing protein [Rhizomicrobium sp.]|jgi:uncharacterized membrane protein